MENQKNKMVCTFEQENLCLQTNILIDRLRTNLLLIEQFDTLQGVIKYAKWCNRLKSLKNEINDIYWKI